MRNTPVTIKLPRERQQFPWQLLQQIGLCCNQTALAATYILVSVACHTQRLNTYLSAHIHTPFAAHYGALSSRVTAGSRSGDTPVLNQPHLHPLLHTITTFQISVAVQRGANRRPAQCEPEGVLRDLATHFHPLQLKPRA